MTDDDVTVNFASVTTPKDRVAIVATEPLTRNEVWTKGEARRPLGLSERGALGDLAFSVTFPRPAWSPRRHA